MANVRLGRRLLKGRERHNVERLKYYAGLVISQEQRANADVIAGVTLTPAVIFDTVTEKKKVSLQDVILRCGKGLEWIAKGHGVPSPDTSGNLP